METDKSPSAVERFYARIRSNPLVTALVLVGSIVIALASFTDAANKLLAPFKKQSPAAARTQLAQMNVEYSADGFVKSAAAGDTTAIALFLKAGMDPDSRTDQQGSALGNAAFAGRAEVVTQLLAAGAHVVGDGDHPSPLGSAAAGGNVDIVKALLDHKPPPEAGAIDEAFFMAARRSTHPQKRNYDVMRLLASRGANVRKVAPEVFEDVFQRGLGEADASEITKVLLDLGADADGAGGHDAMVVKKMTPLMGAAAEGYVSTMNLLLASGARIDIRYDRPEPDDRGWTALMLATKNRKGDAVAALIAKGADVEQTASNGDNALLLAARTGDDGTFPVVLAKATQVDVRDSEGRTPLMLLIEGVQWPGEDVVVSLDAITALLGRGARVDLKDKAGTTALMIAAASGSSASVKLLLDHGARASDRDAKGRRAIDYAQDGPNPARAAEVVKVLQKA